MQQKYAAIRHPELRLKRLDSQLRDGIVYVQTEYDFPAYAARLTVNYAINNVGEIVVEEQVKVTGKADDKSLPRLFRFGMLMTLPADFDRIDYYGRGPGENYADRKTASFLGLYRQTVDEQPYPYIRPQETGTKSDVRWWQQSLPGGWGLRITSDAAFSASALRYSPESLSGGWVKEQLHFPEIDADGRVWLCIDRPADGPWLCGFVGAPCRAKSTAFPTPISRSASSYRPSGCCVDPYGPQQCGP